MMTEYTFTSMDELMEFCDSRRDDKEAHYYWGFIENFDGEKYTIDDLRKEASEEWFEDGAESNIYEFTKVRFYSVESITDNRVCEESWFVFTDEEEAVKKAEKLWECLTPNEKKHTTIFVGTAIAEDAQELEFMDKDEVRTFKVEEAND